MLIKYIDFKPQSKGYVHISAVVEAELSQVESLVLKAKEKPYSLELVQITKKRSLTANAYYQVLLDELSRVMRSSREEVHKLMLRRYGTTKKIKGVPVIFSLRAGIDPEEVSKYVDLIGEEEVEGKLYMKYRIIKGTSEMNSTEFASFLDGVISECKELDIPVLTKEEVKRLK